MKTLVLIIFNVFLLTSGQVLWKKGILESGGISLGNLQNVILSPWILGGLALYVVATGVWFVVLSRADLSYAYPLQSLAYVLGIAAGLLIFKESVPVTRWLGTAIIIAGAAIAAYK